MNISDNKSIIIIEKLLARSAAEHYRKSLASSDFKRGMYCVSQIKCRDKGSVLCVFLDRNGKFADEVMLNRDYGRLHELIFEKVRFNAEKISSNKVFLGRMPDDHDNTEYIIAGGILIADSLNKCGIDLMGYYITDGVSYDNILPERG